jgi:F0F1-type ATP synthase membrane subunit c/vacuolar-type H+-ATPase subunit K
MAHHTSIELKTRYLAVNFLGLVMIGSVFLFAVVVEIFKWVEAPFTGLASLAKSTADLLLFVFFFLALVNYFLIRVMPKKLIARSPQHLPQAAILTFALCEAVAVYGLTLFLLTGRSLDFYLFFAVSLFFFYLFFPKYAAWEEIASAAAGRPPKQRRSQGSSIKAE